MKKRLAGVAEASLSIDLAAIIGIDTCIENVGSWPVCRLDGTVPSILLSATCEARRTCL